MGRAAAAAEKEETSKSAAAHTYDKGYKKWEKFDVDAELARLDGKNEDDQDVGVGNGEGASSSGKKNRRGGGSNVGLGSSAPSSAAGSVRNRRPAAAPIVDREELYKQDGNKHYKR